MIKLAQNSHKFQLELLANLSLFLNRGYSLNEAMNLLKYRYNLENYIKVPIYNKYNGIDYYSICFPLELIVINNNVLNPYLILSSSSMNNSIDFFYNLHTIINNVYNLHVLNFKKFYFLV